MLLKEKDKQAKLQEEQARQARSKPLQQASTSSLQNPVNRQPMGHEEDVALARRKQKSLKRPRPTRQKKQSPKQSTHSQQQQKERSAIPQGPQKGENG